jgi:hypothetical protein
MRGNFMQTTESREGERIVGRWPLRWLPQVVTRVAADNPCRAGMRGKATLFRR